MSEFDDLKQNEAYITRIDRFIAESIAGLAINSIGNLVLLYRRLNQSISNSIYSVKRSRIIQYHNTGAYIQPHTLRVFTRDFILDKDTDRDFEYWTGTDIERNAEYIATEIASFFKMQ